MKMNFRAFLTNSYRLYGSTIADLQNKQAYREIYRHPNYPHAFEFTVYTIIEHDRLVLKLLNYEIAPDTVYLVFSMFKEDHEPDGSEVDLIYFERYSNFKGKTFDVWRTEKHWGF